MTTAAHPRRYVAIGSSYAAGPGIDPAVGDRPAKARQSLRNYPHLIAHRLGLDLADVTSSGATTQDILRRTQFCRWRHGALTVSRNSCTHYCVTQPRLSCGHGLRTLATQTIVCDT